MTNYREQHLEIPKDVTAKTLEGLGDFIAESQRGVNWWLGDLALAAERLLGVERYHQVFPDWISPGLVDRCKAVSKAYKPGDRNILATWTIHMKHANDSDRIAKVQAHVDSGRTSDEARKADQEERAESGRPRWLLAVDVNYFLHRFWFSGAGVEAAAGVSSWVRRTVDRLKYKGLTDIACCFDSKENHRKKITDDWEDKYKDRPPKDPELGQQLNLVRELLGGHGFACIMIDGMEADDCMASFAKQFAGRVTLLTQDKDCRQCLSDRCNMLLDVEWAEDETSGQPLPEYKWLSAKANTESTGIRPEQWADYQAIMGDNVDGVKGAIGIGEKGAADLIKEFGTVEAAIAAAKAEDYRIKPAKRKALIEFEDKLEPTRQLVTLRTDLPIPSNTRI